MAVVGFLEREADRCFLLGMAASLLTLKEGMATVVVAVVLPLGASHSGGGELVGDLDPLLLLLLLWLRWRWWW